MKYGIKETLEFAQFLNSAIKSVRQAKQTGVKATFAGILAAIPLFLPPIGLAQDAFADAKLIPKEFGDLDAAEAAQIVETINAGFELEDRLLEGEIETLFAATLNFYVAILAVAK